MKSSHRTFNQAADSALTKLEQAASTTLTDPNMFKPIETYISKWITGLQEGKTNENDIELATMVLERAGVQALQWLSENHAPFSHKEMVDLLCRKQYDYGHNNITNFGIIGVAIRMCDKIARIENLQKRATPSNESIIDSYLDLVGYSMIVVMLSTNNFLLPLAVDKK